MPLDISAPDGAGVQQRKADLGETSKHSKDGIGSDNPIYRSRPESTDTGKKTSKKKRRRRGRRQKPSDVSDINASVSPDKSLNSDSHPTSVNGHAVRKKTVKSIPADADNGRKNSAPGKKRFRPDGTSHKITPIYSAIDLGTNNCRLLIAKQTRKGFRVIDAFSRIVKLGEGVARDNRLSEEAMDRTIEALKVCAEKLVRRNVTCMRHVATEACRIAENSDEFVERVRLETGINLDVISPGEEARLAVLGCQSLIAHDKKNVLVFDIGGGSTELIWVSVRPGRRNKIMGWMSVPWGVVNLTEEFSKEDGAITPKRYQKMRDAVDKHLVEFDTAHNLQSVLKGRHTQFLGTSGTVTTIASLHLKLPKYVRERVDGAWMRSEEVMRLSRKIADMTPEERALEPCIGEERSSLVVAGCAILEAILGKWDVPSLRVADRGIREGILRGLMQIDTPPKTSRRRYRGRKPNNKNPGAAKRPDQRQKVAE